MATETLDLSDLSDVDEDLDEILEPAGAVPAPCQPRHPWDQPIEKALCDSCGQPIGLPRLLTIGSTTDPAYRARVDPSCLKVLRAEGLTELYAV